MNTHSDSGLTAVPVKADIMTGYLQVSVNEWREMKEQGILMEVQEVKDLVATAKQDGVREEREKFRGEIEKLRRGSPYINGDFTYKNQEAHHYNQALDDLLSKLSIT